MPAGPDCKGIGRGDLRAPFPRRYLRRMNLRLIGIGAGVLVILSLPLAGAIAGPDFAGLDDGKGGGLFSTLGLSEPRTSPAEPPARPESVVGRERPG
ncbi:hypothetical protein SF23_07300, partial [Streptomyces sp. MBRL 10]